MSASVHIGTSGWNYKHWQGRFYPGKFPAQHMLEFYSRHFNTVELNNSFYQLPTFESFRTWRKTAPADFVFAVKGSRFITHLKKLKSPKTSTKKFFTRVKHLEDQLGLILFQLPPLWTIDIGRSSVFLERLPDKYRYAFEFRDPSWFTDQIYELLKQHHAALCVYHMSGYNSPAEITADFVYLRLHGVESTYGGSYSKSQLRLWARRIRAWRDDGKAVFVYFNNDPEAHAVYNAKALRDRSPS